MKPLTITVLIILLTVTVRAQFTLDLVAAQIERDHPIANISADSLHWLTGTSDSSKIMIFDVRAKEEFLKSHLKNAVHVDPDIADSVFLERFAGLIEGKTLIFYCSVGKRSSILAERIQSAVKPFQAEVANLRGGIFRWYNRRYPLYNRSGATRDIHPYNAMWGMLLERQGE